MPRNVVLGTASIDEDFPRAKFLSMARTPIGKRIRELRNGRGWSQLELSRHAQVDNSMISKVETGEVDPSVNWLEKIATGLGVQLVVELVEPAQEARIVRDDEPWAKAVDAYLRTTRGSSTPAWVAAKLMTAAHSHQEEDSDDEAALAVTIHEVRQKYQDGADLTKGAPVIDVPPKKRR